MIWWHKPGVRVTMRYDGEWVDGRTGGATKGPVPVFGEVYEIVDVVLVSEDPGFVLAGLSPSYAWNASGFRPAQPLGTAKGMEMLRALLRPSRVREPAGVQ